MNAERELLQLGLEDIAERGYVSEEWAIFAKLQLATPENPQAPPEMLAVVEAARAWNRHGNRHGLSTAVIAYEATLRKPSLADELEAWWEHPTAEDRHSAGVVFRSLIARLREQETP